MPGARRAGNSSCVSVPVGKRDRQPDVLRLPLLADGLHYPTFLAAEHIHRHGVRHRRLLAGRTAGATSATSSTSPFSHAVSYTKSAAITKALTRQYGLTFGKGKDKVRRERLKGKDAIKYRLYDTITAALKDCVTWDELRKLLATKGISLDFVR